MLNLYAVTVWHASAPRHAEMIEVRTYTARRAEHLASESFPGCIASAQQLNFEPDYRGEAARRTNRPSRETRAAHAIRDA